MSFLKDNLTEIAIVPEEVTLNVGEEIVLKIQGFGDGIIKTVQVANADFDFESSEDTYATVSAEGLVEAKAEGVATITATSKKNPVIKDTITVNVVTA